MPNTFIQTILCCTLLSLSVINSSNALALDKSKRQLPNLKNWFFSAGEWESQSQLFVREIGNGERLVVMLHGGWGAEHSGLVNMIHGLEDEFRFVFYEQRGSLRSPSPESLINYNQHIEDLEALRKQLGQKKLTLLGHSMGAVLASAYAKRYPDKIDKLVLISPAYLKKPVPDHDQPTKHKAWLLSKAYITEQRLSDEIKRYNLERTTPPLSHKEMTAKDRINFASTMLYDIQKWPELTNGKPLYRANVYNLTEKSYPDDGWNFWQEFAKQQYPVSIISGSHDRFDFDGLLLKHWNKEAPSVSVTILPDAGHLPWIDQQVKLVALIKKHL